ncbi:MAG: ABC transporter ATP-binding protein [Bacillota bacterium]
MLLEVKNITVDYDTAMLLNDVSLAMMQGELLSLVGPNGAGKTTLLRAITGLVRWDRETKQGTKAGNIGLTGQVLFNGEDISNLPAYEIARRGLILCPERRRPFTEMTVQENLKAGAYLYPKHYAGTLDFVYHLFPRLKEREKQISGTMSGGEQQMLAIGRALMSKPKLLCIDEPSTGLAPLIKRDLFDKIKEINEGGIALLLVEQDVALSFSLSTRGYILSHGKIVAQGTSQELLKDETVRRAYLGL